jgi:hypothetical protein
MNPLRKIDANAKRRFMVYADADGVMDVNGEPFSTLSGVTFTACDPQFAMQMWLELVKEDLKQVADNQKVQARVVEVFDLDPIVFNVYNTLAWEGA